MNKLTEQQMKRIKEALRSMRESSGEKYEIVRDIHGLDPSHVERGESFPTLNTIMNYCRLFDRCPGWLWLLSCQVDKGNISENEFTELIKNWEQYKTMAEWKMDEFIKMARATTTFNSDWKQKKG